MSIQSIDGESKPAASKALLERDLWRYAERIESAWRYLNQVLDMEWQALLSDEVFKMQRLAAKKEALARFIESQEKGLRQAAEELIQMAGCEETGRRPVPAGGPVLERLEAAVDFASAKRLQYWRLRRNLHKKQAADANRRIMTWITGRLELLEGVEEAFRKGFSPSPSLYGRTGRGPARLSALAGSRPLAVSASSTSAGSRTAAEGISRYLLLQGS